MATIKLTFVSKQYDETDLIKVSEKAFAYPINIELDGVTLQTALQSVISRHRAYMYTVECTLEGRKTEPNETVISRLNEAIQTCNDNKPAWSPANDDEYHGVQLLAYAIDNSMTKTYLNNKVVMNMPVNADKVLVAFRDYKDGRCKFNDLKKQVIEFAEGLNNVPFLKDRTIKFNDTDITELYNMYTGIGQIERWNKKGISGRRVTKTALIQQIILKALKKTFKFEETKTIERPKYTTF